MSAVTPPKVSILSSSFESKLPPFLSAQYKTIIVTCLEKINGSKADNEAKLHEDVTELVDGLLAMLPLQIDQVLGFVSAQIESLVKAADLVCVACSTDKKIPSHRILVCDRRYIRTDLHPTFYDVTTNKDQSTPQYLPIETVSYSFGAVYARLVWERKTKKASEGSNRQ
jgi:hypothetical protein